MNSTTPPPIPVIYIAGPYTASDARNVELNVRVAEEMAYALYRLGASPICPHTTTRFVDKRVPYQFMCDATLAQMLRCDGVIFLDGWKNSTGSIAEHDAAIAKKLLTFYSLSELQVWLLAKGVLPIFPPLVDVS